VEELRSYLTATPCVTTDGNGTTTPELDPPVGFKDPLDARLQAQAAAARGEPGAIGRLDDQMRGYRRELLVRLRPHNGGAR